MSENFDGADTSAPVTSVTDSSTPTPQAPEPAAPTETTGSLDSQSTADPFSREGAFQVPWDEIEASINETPAAAAGEESPNVPEQGLDQMPAPPAEEMHAGSVRSQGASEAGAEAATDPKDEGAAATEHNVAEPDLAARVTQLGGADVLDLVAPLFEASDESPKP